MKLNVDNEKIIFRQDDGHTELSADGLKLFNNHGEIILSYKTDGTITWKSTEIVPLHHAHWIKLWEKDDKIRYKCSHCGSEITYYLQTMKECPKRFCDQCGAKMDEEVQDDG